MSEKEAAAEEVENGSVLPEGIRNFLETLGGMASFFGRFWREVFFPPYEFQEVMHQCYVIGNQSLPLVAATGLIMGMVLTLQSLPTMEDFGAESMVPSMVAISVVREIGPVITSIIAAGKVGSSIGAELASMRVTEQIDAMEVSGTRPFKYLVVTRVLAATLMLPLLVAFANVMAMIGSFLGINIFGETSLLLFKAQVFSALSFYDLVPATIKTFFFGFFIGLASCYMGYNAGGGTVGVGKAANAAVVVSILLVFILDALAVQTTNLIYDLFINVNNITL